MNRAGSITTKNINSIKSDIIAAKTISNMQIYKNQPLKLRKRLALQWINGTRWNYNKFKSPYIHLKLRKDMIEMKKYLESLFEEGELDDLPEFRDLKMKIKKIPKKFIKALLNPLKYKDFKS